MVLPLNDPPAETPVPLRSRRAGVVRRSNSSAGISLRQAAVTQRFDAMSIVAVFWTSRQFFMSAAAEPDDDAAFDGSESRAFGSDA